MLQNRHIVVARDTCTAILLLGCVRVGYIRTKVTRRRDFDTETLDTTDQFA